MSNNRQQQANILRTFRDIHRKTGAILFGFFFFVSISGIFLGWSIKGLKGESKLNNVKNEPKPLNEWLSLDSLEKISSKIMLDSVGNGFSNEVERMEIRKNKGFVKFGFKKNPWSVTLDGATGKALNIEKRGNELFEHIHDGSIIDEFLGLDGIFKRIYTTIMGLALLTFTITGFWLWYGPKRMKSQK